MASRTMASCALAMLLSLFAVIAAMWPTIINGFPIIYDDSNIYLGFPETIDAPFPIFYSVAVWGISKVGGLFSVVIGQALLVAGLIGFAIARLTLARPAGAALATIVVLALTQLPWLASWLTADVAGSLGALAIILLTLSPSERFGWSTVLLFAIVAGACLVATSNLLSFLPFGLACLIIRRVVIKDRVWHHRALIGLTTAAGCVALSMLTNLAINDRFTLAMGSSARLFNKLADNGLAQRFLARRCPTERLPACRHLSEIQQFTESEEFLWGRAGKAALSERTGAWEDRLGDYGGLSTRIIATYPAETLTVVMRDTGTLLGKLSFDRSERELVPHDDTGSETRKRIERHHRQDVALFHEARQQTEDLWAVYPDRFYVHSTLLSYVLLLVVLLVALLRKDRTLIALCLSSALVVLLMALVHGGLSSPVPRYNLKFSWMPWLCVVVGAMRLFFVKGLDGIGVRSAPIMESRRGTLRQGMS